MDPASLFTRQMFALAEDHCIRMIDQTSDLIRFASEQLQMLPSRAPVAGVLLAQVMDPAPLAEIDPMQVDDGPPLQLAPITDPAGRLPMRALLSAIERTLSPQVPIYLLPVNLDGQLALLSQHP